MYDAPHGELFLLQRMDRFVSFCRPEVQTNREQKENEGNEAIPESIAIKR
jgi:hypothetical protein